MHVTDTSTSFVYVYSSVQSIVIVVQRDEAFLAQSIPVLERFYFSFYITELLHCLPCHSTAVDKPCKNVQQDRTEQLLLRCSVCSFEYLQIFGEILSIK